MLKNARIITAAFVLAFTCSIQAATAQAFNATIPVVDMNDFFNPEKKQAFIEEVCTALHEIGFFAVINPQMDMEELNLAYTASKEFFTSPIECKEEIYRQELNGQRGYVPSETAQGFNAKDYKEFIHIGRNKNLWPTWMDLKTPFEKLMVMLDINSEVLQKAFALGLGEDENFLVDMTCHGECLIRALHYPKNPDPGVYWAAKHTDISLFTILPMATEEGLQVFHDGCWIDVQVPPHAFIVNGGDKLQNLSNGYFKSSLHQVVAKPNLERYSIVYFVHPRDSDSVSPTKASIAKTEGVARYPEATSLELLATRLRELGLASPSLLQFEIDSQIMDRVKALVEANTAAEPVQHTYQLWKR